MNWPRLIAPVSMASRKLTSSLRTGHSGVVLAYHDIIPDSKPVYPYAVTESTFLHQIDIVVGLGLNPVPLAEFTNCLLAGDASNLVAIVFDDALVGVHKIALPHLAQRKIPWTLLPVTSRCGVAPTWWPEASRTMTVQEIREALAGGASLCGHTATHRSLTELSPTAIYDELVLSRETLSEWAGHEVHELCYPFGHQNQIVRSTAIRAGYRAGYSFTNGRCHPDTDYFAQPRLAMHEDLKGLRWTAMLLRPKRSWPEVTDLTAEIELNTKREET